jgi:hypothetical protein
MIILLHNQDESTFEFLKYLKEKSAEYISLTTNDLIQHIRIIDNLNDNTDRNCTWTHQAQNIHFSEVEDIYNVINGIDIHLFDDYIAEDRLYVQNEWLAYITYWSNSVKNCMNPITTHILSGTIYQFPFMFKIAESVGLTIPLYVVSSNFDDLVIFSKNKRFICREDISVNYDFCESKSLTENSIGLIEYIKGNSIILHIIKNKIFGCILENGEKKTFCPNKNLSNKCLALTNALSLPMMELLFKKVHNQYILYNIYPFPQWKRNAKENLNEIFKALYNALTNKHAA